PALVGRHEAGPTGTLPAYPRRRPPRPGAAGFTPAKGQRPLAPAPTPAGLQPAPPEPAPPTPAGGPLHLHGYVHPRHTPTPAGPPTHAGRHEAGPTGTLPVYPGRRPPRPVGPGLPRPKANARWPPGRRRNTAGRHEAGPTRKT